LRSSYGNQIQLFYNDIACCNLSYTGSPYYPASANPSPTFSGGGVAGTFTSTAGLVLLVQAQAK